LTLSAKLLLKTLARPALMFGLFNMTNAEFEALVSSDLAMLVEAAQAKQRAAELARITELVAEGMSLEQAMMMFEGEQE